MAHSQFYGSYDEIRIRELKKNCLLWATNLIDSPTILKDIPLDVNDLVNILRMMQFGFVPRSNNREGSGIKIEITCLETNQTFVLIKSPSRSACKQIAQKAGISSESAFIVNNLLHFLSEIIANEKRRLTLPTYNKEGYLCDHVYEMPITEVSNLKSNGHADWSDNEDSTEVGSREESPTPTEQVTNENKKAKKKGFFGKFSKFMRSMRKTKVGVEVKLEEVVNIDKEILKPNHQVVYPEQPGSLSFTSALSTSYPNLSSACLSQATLRDKKGLSRRPSIAIKPPVVKLPAMGASRSLNSSRTMLYEFNYTRDFINV